jgi:hypothetical protein
MWIPMYLLMLFAVTVVAGWQRTSLRVRGRNISIGLIVIASLVHVYDTRGAVTAVRTRFTETKPSFVSDDPRWDIWAEGKRHLVAIPPLSNDPRWIDLAVLAQRHDLTTNAAYVSRKDETQFAELAESTQALLERRAFSDDTLYVITNYPPNPESPKLLAASQISPSGSYEIHQVEELVVVVP